MRGEVHAIPAIRGKRLNVLAALFADGSLFSTSYWQTTTAPLFGEFLQALVAHVNKPITLILDNASIHKAKVLEPVLEQLREKGLELYFLPAYSPELNRIEKLWHKMKHTLLAFKARDPETLKIDVGAVLRSMGAEWQGT